MVLSLHCLPQVKRCGLGPWRRIWNDSSDQRLAGKSRSVNLGIKICRYWNLRVPTGKNWWVSNAQFSSIGELLIESAAEQVNSIFMEKTKLQKQVKAKILTIRATLELSSFWQKKINQKMSFLRSPPVEIPALKP